MSEERLSVALFRQARDDDRVALISWQAVDGKGYFTRDVKLRLPSGERMEPDLVLVALGLLWLMELKGRHSEALADEAKLTLLRAELSDDALREQIGRHAPLPPGVSVRMAVCYEVDDVPALTSCAADVGHLCVPATDQTEGTGWLFEALRGFTTL